MTAAVVAGELVAVDLIAPDHWRNPRGKVDTTSEKFLELKASIEAQGLLEPIVVGPPLLELGGKHAIVAGWRRYTAALELGHAGVPVHQRIDITDAKSALLAALAENMAREDMTPLAEASSIHELVELGMTQIEAAKAVGVSERTARERLRLLDLPKPVRAAIDRGDVPTTCTRQLQLVADASPAAASAIAKKITGGKVRALELQDPGMFARVLRDLNGPDLVELTSSTLLNQLGLPRARQAALLARNKKVKQSWESDGLLDLSTGWIGKKLLDEARAAGKIVTVERPGYPTRTYLAGAEFIDRAAEASVAKAERAAARRAAEEKKLRAANKEQSSAPLDPRQRAQHERDDRARAIDKRAKPYAAAMNAEIGQRLRALKSVKIDGAIARLLVLLHDPQVSSFSSDLSRFAFAHVDPERELAEDWARQPDPGKAAAELVAVLVAATCSDLRATGKNLPHWATNYPTDLIAQIARDLELLPDRAIAYIEARERHAAQTDYYGFRGTRRRILFELTKAPAGKLEHEALRLAAKDWGRDAGELHEIDIKVYGNAKFDTALEQLLAAGHVKKAGKNAYAITADGRADLKTDPGPAPLFDDIDGEADAPAPDVAPSPGRGRPPVDGARSEQAFALVDARPGITIPELAELMGVKQNYLYRVLPALQDDGRVFKDGRGWHPRVLDDTGNAVETGTVVLVHVKPTHGDGEPVEAELQPDPPKGSEHRRKVIYTSSRTAAWVAANRIIDLPVPATA